jgi:hypothetical protein
MSAPAMLSRVHEDALPLPGESKDPRESSAVTKRAPWFVPYFTLAHRIAVLREWLGRSTSHASRSRLRDRVDVLTQEQDDETLELLDRPLVNRAPALARWAEKVQRARTNVEPLALAAAHEVEALAWEEVGDFANASKARQRAAFALGALPDVAGFRTDNRNAGPDAHA